VITYQGITIRANYFVVDTDGANLVRSVSELDSALVNPKTNIFIYNTGPDYVLTTSINNAIRDANVQNLNFVGIPNDDGELPVIKGLSFSVKDGKTVSFSNMKFTNNGTEKEIVKTLINSPTTAIPGKVKFESCEFEAVEAASIGISTIANILNHEITNCQFINTDTGYYEVVVGSSSTQHNYYYGTDLIVRNNIIRGSFGYVFGSSSYGKFENNTVEYIHQTINPYKAYKQPVAFHATPIGHGTEAYEWNGDQWVENTEFYNAYQLSINNNKLINLENVFRIYRTDLYDLTGKDELAHYGETIIFRNNELENCSFLVNKSSSAWSSNLATYLINCLDRDEKSGGYVNQERFVIQMNTGLIRNSQPLVIQYTGGELSGNFKVVSGLDYQEKYTTTPDFLYKFEGRFGIEEVVNGKNEMVYRYYLSQGEKLFTIESSASLDGLDKRVITEVDSTQGAAAYYFFFGE